MMLWMLLACTPQRLDTGFWRLEYQSPNIEIMQVECKDAEWTIEVWTDHWAGNGLLWIASEQRYERHTLYSISASPTGDGDRLRVTLTVVNDWRDFQSGKSSGFDCSAHEHLGFFVGVRHPQTSTITDCAEYVDSETFMDEPTLDLWDQVPLPDCPLPESTTPQ